MKFRDNTGIVTSKCGREKAADLKIEVHATGLHARGYYTLNEIPR